MVLRIKDAKQANQLGINWKSLFNGTEKQLQELNKTIVPHRTSRTRGAKYTQRFRVATNAQKLIFNLNAQSKNKFSPKKLINAREHSAQQKIDIGIV